MAGMRGLREGVEAPVASSSAFPSVIPSPVVRSVSISPVDAGMLGMHVAAAQEGDWPADSVSVASLRLWDTGTSWLQRDESAGAQPAEPPVASTTDPLSMAPAGEQQKEIVCAISSGVMRRRSRDASARLAAELSP